MLWHTVVLAIDNPPLRVLCKVEAFFGENREEIMKDSIALDFWNVFDTDDVRPHLAHQATEILQQSPLRIFRVFQSLGVLRERLTRGASDEDSSVPGRILRLQLLGCKSSYALLMKFGAGIVALVWVAAIFVDIVACNDVQPGVR